MLVSYNVRCDVTVVPLTLDKHMSSHPENVKSRVALCSLYLRAKLGTSNPQGGLLNVLNPMMEGWFVLTE